MSISTFVFSNFAYYLIHLPVFFLSTLVFRFTGNTPWFSYWSMRKLYYFEGERFRNRDKYLGIERKIQQPLSDSSVFQFDEATLETAVDSLKEDGFALLPVTLPKEKIEYLTRLAHTLVPSARTKDGNVAKLEMANPKHARYDFSEKDLRNDPVIQNLAKDQFIYSIASRYLQCSPKNDLIAMWWNFYQPEIDKNLIAQSYHSDIDRIRFLKFFFYLTDVNQENGPHCFIKRSHRNCPKELRKDKRFSDEEVFKHFSRDSEMIFTAPAGTILVEDTIGLHKGMPLKSGSRLMFQLEFSSSLYGQSHY